MAHDNYLQLRNHDGVGFALAYIGNDGFGVPLDALPAVADRWVTEDFLNPDYVRIDGKPLLVVYEINDAAQLWGVAAGVNKGIEIIQQAAKRHGLPGVFVVGTHQEPTEYTQGCFLNCGYDGDLLAQHWDALSKYTFNDDVKPIDGPIPYSRLAAAEEAIWQRYAQQSAFHFIPSVPAGWDERSTNGELVHDASGTPRLFWYPRTADEVGGLLHDAIGWVDNNPQTRVEPAPAPPVVLIEAWNELQEGAYVAPTAEDGYSYGRAIAQAVGIPWVPPPKHTLRVVPSSRATVSSTPAGISCPPTCAASFDEGVQVTLAASAPKGSVLDSWRGCTDTDPTCGVVLLGDATAHAVVTATRQRRRVSLHLSGPSKAHGTLSVIDGFSDCTSYETIVIARRANGRLRPIVSTQADARGRYSARARLRPGTYQALAPRTTLTGHICLAAASSPVRYTP
jgi:hypothetical protein